MQNANGEQLNGAQTELMERQLSTPQRAHMHHDHRRLNQAE